VATAWRIGKCNIAFGARFSERPLLEIGAGTSLGHNTSFTVESGSPSAVTA